MGSLHLTTVGQSLKLTANSLRIGWAGNKSGSSVCRVEIAEQAERPHHPGLWNVGRSSARRFLRPRKWIPESRVNHSIRRTVRL